jgi:hypothetical protein
MSGEILFFDRSAWYAILDKTTSNGHWSFRVQKAIQII